MIELFIESLYALNPKINEVLSPLIEMTEYLEKKLDKGFRINSNEMTVWLKLNRFCLSSLIQLTKVQRFAHVNSHILNELRNNNDKDMRLTRAEKATFLDDYSEYSTALGLIKEKLVTMSPIFSQLYSEFPN